MFLTHHFILLVITFSTTTSKPSHLNKISPELELTLESKGVANAKVSFLASNTHHIVQSVRYSKYPNREARLKALASRLSKHASRTQADVIQLIRDVDPTQKLLPLWISNQIFLPNASRSLIHRINEIPSVKALEEELIILTEDTPPVTPAPSEHVRVSRASKPRGWSIEWIHAPDFWRKHGNGSGITVASIDTGVLHTHEALRSNFRGSHYGWFDPYNFFPEPTDPDGHGTHVLGTICGNANGIGVAPGAQWIACRGCEDYECAESAILACGQWMACPTLPNGTNPDCAKAPHVINNSWDVPPGSTWFDPVISAWRAVGIIPVFAAGNNGTDCGTVSYPGEHADVITVGATDEENILANYSSKGPTTEGIRKPDICAPGEAIRSSSNKGPSSYKLLYGTSMAVPHVVGTIALLLSIDPTLTYEEIKRALVDSARKSTTIQDTGISCGSIPETRFPNNAYGAGVIDAMRAIKFASRNRVNHLIKAFK